MEQPSRQVGDEEITHAAFEFWKEAGRPADRDLAHWLKLAERSLAETPGQSLRGVATQPAEVEKAVGRCGRPDGLA